MQSSIYLSRKFLEKIAEKNLEKIQNHSKCMVGKGHKIQQMRLTKYLNTYVMTSFDQYLTFKTVSEVI